MHNTWSDFIKKIPVSGQIDKITGNGYFLADLTDHGVIKISGIDAKKFLQGQLTCNINTIPENKYQLAAHCNPQGRIISLFHLAAFQDDFYLSMPRNMTSIAMAALKKYAIFFKVNIADISDEFITVGIIGSNLSQKESATDIILARMLSNIERYLLIGKPSDILKHLEKKIEQLQLITMNTWNILNIHDGIPSLNPETTAMFLPHELNIDMLNAISFDKGCYTGQEIIARMHYRGKLKTRMHKAKIISKSLIQPGSDIFTLEDQQPHIAGKIVATCPDINNCYHVLMTLDESSKDNREIFLDSNQHSYFTLTD